MVEVIAALDLPGRDEALRWLDRVPALRWVKVGSVLMTREGAPFIRELTGRGLAVFLDLKWHDIPNTVAGAVAAARSLGVRMATVHTLGGRAMLEAASEAAGPELGVVGVTVLTSLDAAALSAALGRPAVDPAREVERLAHAARDAGLRGVVCSPLEAASVRRVVGPGGWVVVPGIRRAGDAPGDQARTATPIEAVRAGASHLVVGRPLLNAPDPAAVLTEFLGAGA
ncbi:MAG TPA: orotidine-5'-phosphate decarboxylase [Gemmatimonadales bacterium]|nr:orotidine-5'-phosphate decarboxylase [Gemmatimonadales bacterium]